MDTGGGLGGGLLIDDDLIGQGGISVPAGVPLRMSLAGDYINSLHITQGNVTIGNKINEQNWYVTIHGSGLLGELVFQTF